jgi:chemotaxis protein histidine kinase CheA
LADVLNAVSPDYAVVAQKDAEANQLVLFDDAFARQYGYSLDDLLEMYRRDSERPLQESVRELDRQVRELLHARQTEFSLVAAETRAAVAEERLRAAEERIEREQKRAETAAEQARQAEAKAVQAEARAQEVDSCAAQAEAREAEAKGQMQQALEAAQQAQELASLAEERLRAVEERVEREQQRAETAVEQARQAETRAVHAAAKAEAAEARAAQAEANLQELRARSEREKQDLAAQGEAALRTAREQVNDLEQELAAMRAKVDELNASSHHWWTEADRLNRELHAIYAGESWKLTYPLRKAKQWVIRLYETLARLARGVKALLQSGTRWAAAFVRRRPKLKAGLLRAVRRVPGLEERLRRLARNAGVGAVYNGSPVSPFTITHTKTSRPTSMEAATPVEGQEADVPGLAAMTPRARCIYHDLKAAIEQQQQRGS